MQLLEKSSFGDERHTKASPNDRTPADVWGLGFGVWGLGFGVWGLGFRVWGLGLGYGFLRANQGSSVPKIT